MNSILLVSLAVPILIVVVVVVVLRRSGMFGMSAAKKEQAAALVASGRKARATILRIEPTGVIINHINIQCRVTFRLQPLDGSPAFDQDKTIVIPQTHMPRIGDVWPSWYELTDPSIFVVGMPDGAQQEQVPIFREFGIPHPLDPGTAAAPESTDTVADLERLSQLHSNGALTDEEFRAAKARLLDD